MAFYMNGQTKKLVFLLLILGGLQIINVTQGCSEPNEYGYNGYKNVGSVTDVLLKHIEVFNGPKVCFCG
jgi:hypothetical protein